MTTLKFVTDGRANIVKIETRFFLSHLRVKHHLEQQIAQLTAQIVKIFTRNSVQHFVGFFEGVGRDSGESLLFVPRAAVFRVTQAFHYAEQAVDLGHEEFLVKIRNAGRR